DRHHLGSRGSNRDPRGSRRRPDPDLARCTAAKGSRTEPQNRPLLELTLLRPSLGRVVRGGHANYQPAILTQDEFREAVHSVGAMMQETSVLESDEQD